VIYAISVSSKIAKKTATRALKLPVAVLYSE
jgi:hypothetical protein